MSTQCKALLLAAVLLAVPAAQASAPQQEVVLGVSNLDSFSFIRPAYPLLSLEASYLRAASSEGFGRWLYFGGGLRTGFALAEMNVPVEGFLRGQLVAQMGPWRPAAGLELGLNLMPLLLRTSLPVTTELVDRETALFGPAYLAFHAAPLRLLLFDRLLLSVLELRVGPTGPPVGPAVRIQLGLFQAGVVL